jgi:hypothetical protein
VSVSVHDKVFHFCYCLVYSTVIFLLILIYINVVVIVFVVVLSVFTLYSLRAVSLVCVVLCAVF